MFNRILTFLSGPPVARPLPAMDAAHLLGALMVRIAGADERMKLSELQVIDRLFARRFELNAIEAARMRADCERLEAVLPATESLGPMLVATIPPEQRFSLREALREVAEADGSLDPRESAMIEQVAQLLQEDQALQDPEEV